MVASAGDVRRVAHVTTQAVAPAAATPCQLCGGSIPARARKDSVFCGKKCRQMAWRLKNRSGALLAGPGTAPGQTFAYADPPYPGKAWLYKAHPDYGGEVDHVAMARGLDEAGHAGYAISTSQDALFYVLLCMTEAQGVEIPRPLPPFHEFKALFKQWPEVCPWTKPTPIRGDPVGIVNRHEYVVVVGGRKRRPAVPDFLHAAAARGGGHDLVGRKPPAFNAWLFDLLGMVPGDELADLFPGTGGVARAWGEVSRSAAQRDASSLASSDASPTAANDASPRALDDASPVYGGCIGRGDIADASPLDRGRVALVDATQQGAVA